MKTRTKPKVFLKREISNIYSKPKRTWEDIGRINLVSYMTGKDTPHLEFEIFDEFEEYRNKGIMSLEIKKYLKLCKKWGHTQLIANVKKDNIPSIKILEKNNFAKLTEFRDIVVYITSLDITKDQIKNCIKKIS